MDWGKTPLGPLAQWPESLRTTVSLVLASSFPINLVRGLRGSTGIAAGGPLSPAAVAADGDSFVARVISTAN